MPRVFRSLAVKEILKAPVMRFGSGSFASSGLTLGLEFEEDDDGVVA